MHTSSMQMLNHLVTQSLQRIQESTLGVLNIINPALRQHLREQISDELGNTNCFLADPVIEHTFGWHTAELTFKDLAEEGLFSDKLLDVLKNAGKNYSFLPTAHPYVHQLQAWRHLLNEQAQSAIITSGTGSGKTECFMIPILEDLIRRQQVEKGRLIGVQALFLYPLNALINSQKERLDAWTQDFGKNIRYCLYNGNTKEYAENRDQDKPNEIQSRDRLRQEPPPILMTNATMLEYMLVRQIDAPILQKSKQAGSLRWIVLDEAHSYIGSQAAEIALLLRRVIHAFGKRPQDVRFVATSATIASTKAEEELRNYLADLAGVAPEQIAVISGTRSFDDIPLGDGKDSLERIVTIDEGQECSDSRFTALTNSATATILRHELTKTGIPQTLNGLVQQCAPYLYGANIKTQQHEVLNWLDVMTQTRQADGTPFLKLRMHLFQSMLHGLWACMDSACSCKSPELQDLKNWGFGQVYINRRSRCDCGAPILELVLCQDCGEVHLLAQEKDGKLHQCDTYVVDEFSLYNETDETTEEEEENIETYSSSSLLLARADIQDNNYNIQKIDKKSAEIGTKNGEITTAITFASYACCANPLCQKENKHNKTFYRSLYLGAPFYVTQAVPTVLEFCAEEKNLTNDLPASGRRLITFTDSRQGTARIAVKMQQEAEYSKTRGLVFEILVQKAAKTPDISPEIAGLIDKLRAQKTPESLIEQILANTLPADTSISWEDMCVQLERKEEISKHILPYNRDANPRLFGDASGDGAKQLAELLLVREFARRPSKSNNLETLGLAAVCYPKLERITSAPEKWEASYSHTKEGLKQLTLADWKIFLKMLLDFYIRENSFVTLPEYHKRWLGRHFSGKRLVSPDTDFPNTNRLKRWPQMNQKGQQSRPVKILQAVTGWSLGNPLHKDTINLWLRTAWQQLTENQILTRDNDGYCMHLEQMSFRLPKQVWQCPFTHRLIEEALCGISPYLPFNFNNRDYRELLCEKIVLPEYGCFIPKSTSEPKQQQMRRLLIENSEVVRLREQGIWSNLHDRIIEGGFYYRTAEHSAQIGSQKLQKYEREFKDGKINVLSCSTTMEMGVDIGGMVAVVMNNVPPHPANYLQRAGRAGRRSETVAVAYTLCKADPHNNRVFNDSLWAFKTPIATPQVSLSSKKIVIRHVHSLMLAGFLHQRNDTEGNNARLNILWFFESKKQIWKEFCDWVERLENTDLNIAIQELVKGTPLEIVPLANIKKQVRTELSRLVENWQGEYLAIKEKLKTAQHQYKNALEREKKSHENDNLLAYLAVNRFLPSYGFPTDVVQFKIYNMEEYLDKKQAERDDNLFVRREYPSRSLDIALREYAPGAQVVVDGRVYRSAGIDLHVKSAGRGHNETQQLNTKWRCQYCGAIGVTPYKYSIDSIQCIRCKHEIDNKNKETVLCPEGFRADFYEQSSNDISIQKFIKPKQALVQLGENSQSVTDIDFAEIYYGDGTIFYCSSGEFGYGFAVCLRCGRADSMTADNEIPLELTKEHPALGGGSDAAQNKGNKGCSASNVHKNLHLGHNIQTDILEIALKNLHTGEYLSPEHKVVARTLAVAIRDEIAAYLGIETIEMGFATREDKVIETDTIRQIIQIYDQASGGAGFVLAVVSNIHDIVKRAFRRLNCSADCASVCQYCLWENDNNVGSEELNRHLALEWLEGAGLLF